MLENQRKPRPADTGLSLIEVMIVLAAISLLAGVAIPQLMPTRQAAEEGSAIASVRQLMNAQTQYSVTRGKEFATLAELAEAGLVSEQLADGEDAGYLFEVEPKENAGYAVTAVPVEESDFPRRRFYGDETGVIRYTGDGTPATSSSSSLGGDSSVALIPDLE